jgi:hypothetical protein
MKSLPVIIVTALASLCAIGCILLIIVILRTSDGNNSLLTPLHRLFNHPQRSESTAPDAIRLPERFTESSESPSADTANATAAREPLVPAPAYKREYTCGEMIAATALSRIIKENGLFCKKSPWSKEWANPKGRGIRQARSGLAFADSVVTDTLTGTMWQRFTTPKPVSSDRLDSVISAMNTGTWQGYNNWRIPTVEELLTLLTPSRNHFGHYLPSGWNSKADDIWSCNSSCDSLSMRWMWVVRMSLGRCNVGRPDIKRAILAVRELR